MNSLQRKRKNYWNEMPGNHSAFEDIYEVVKLIPRGRVTSYGAISRYLGIKSARMVGWAMNGLHNRPEIPAHRVVNSSGVLTGADAFDPKRPMEKLLSDEGVKVKNNRVANFKNAFWDPSEELP